MSEPNDQKLPRATHTATLSIGGVELVCHVLDDGRRVLDEESVTAFFAMLEGQLTEEDAVRVARFVRGDDQ